MTVGECFWVVGGKGTVYFSAKLGEQCMVVYSAVWHKLFFFFSGVSIMLGIQLLTTFPVQPRMTIPVDSVSLALHELDN